MLPRIFFPLCLGLLATPRTECALAPTRQDPDAAPNGLAAFARGSTDAWPRAAWISALELARDQARAWGKPLLVFVVPESTAVAREHGALLGEVLERADDELLLDLLGCELACAPLSELNRIAPDLLSPTDPLAFLFELEGANISGRALSRTRVRELAESRPRAIICGTDPDADNASIASAQASACADLLRELISAGPAQRAALVARQRNGHEVEAAGIERGARGVASLPTWLADRWAPLLRAIAESDSPRAAFVRERLIAAARREYLEEPPRGSAWTIQQGFYYALDGQTGVDTCPPCGMGHVTKDARRFLSFYAGTEFERIGKAR